VLTLLSFGKCITSDYVVFCDQHVLPLLDDNVVECNGITDLAFVLHSGGSVHPERWHHVTQFVVSNVNRLDVHANRTRVAVVTWSDSAHIAFTLDQFTSRQDINQVLVI